MMQGQSLLTTSDIKSLSSIKYLAQQAKTFTKGNIYKANIALLLYHDAVESLLYQIKLKKGIKNELTFPKYWENIETLSYERGSN
jgi:hypothetical protein